MKLASFDIFDTTLIRKCGRPKNIFYILAHKLYPNDDEKRDKFFKWRCGAEGEACRWMPGKELTIDDIYNSDELKLFGEYSKKELIEAEKEVEKEQLIANPKIKDTICKKRNEGYTICFISDMYLDSATLKTALTKEGCINDDETVYVSCEWNARKSNGELYKKIKAELTPGHWEHYGDHPVSDIKRAQSYGIEAHLVTTAFNSAEMSYIQPATEKLHYESSILSGLCRAARITFSNKFATLAADFVAPAYIPYVNYVIERSKQDGIKTLYFLSRDSYILQRIAEQMPHDGIELKYLFVSRKALLLPYLHNATAEKFLAVQDKSTIIGKDVKSILASLETDTAELKNDFGIEFEYNRISDKEQETDFLEKIFSAESRYLPQLNERAKKRHSQLVEYLKQEELLTGESTAMVDVGWLGTTRLMINSILKELGCGESKFFYYGVRGDVLGKQYGEYYTYYTPQQLSTTGTTLIENYFSSSPYPSTIGYEKKKEEIAPIFADNESYNENDIVTSNVAVAQWICNEIAKTPVTLNKHFWHWGYNAVMEIQKLKKDIDISPLCKASEFDSTSFVRHLSKKEMFNIICLGGRATAFDRGSLKITIGNGLFPVADKVARFTGKIRRWLYLELHK